MVWGAFSGSTRGPAALFFIQGVPFPTGGYVLTCGVSCGIRARMCGHMSVPVPLVPVISVRDVSMSVHVVVAWSWSVRLSLWSVVSRAVRLSWHVVT